MPRMDGTGPMGQGAMTGWERGVCTSTKGVPSGYGCRGGRGFGRGLGICRTVQADSRELLTTHKEVLQNQLAFVEKQLQEMK